MNSATSNQTLDIQGTNFDYAEATGRIVLAAGCVGLGFFLLHALWTEDPKSEAKFIAGLIPAITWIIAAILPYKAHTFLDFGNSQLVTLNYYAWLRISSRRRPLTDFGSITVRHVCHPGGEGPDTFTGSVGLKPTDGGAVFWLKEFPTTQDEMPREAHEYAHRLKEVLPLPITMLGLEFLDLEKSKFTPPETSPKADQASRTVGMPRRPDTLSSLI